MAEVYEPTWESLRTHTTPQWLREAKFGIYTHWGVYSVPACGPNGSWYPYNMYREGNPQYDYHVKNYGHPSEFGYKDLIPLFTAEKFDPDEWADLFKKSGAKFAGPVAEHHDGFAMWDTKLSKWNAAKMGPRTNVVGRLEKSIRAQGLKFMVALHHLENWYFYPHWRKEFDTSNPKYAGLYAPMHNQDWGDKADDERWAEWGAQDRPGREFLDYWLAKIHEVIDEYRPDLMWYDFGIRFTPESYRKKLLAYYYNKEEEWGTEVAVTYKNQDLLTGSALIDYELGRMDALTYNEWITDTSVDDQGAWSFVSDAAFKPAKRLVHNLIDNVSKNGYMLLNVGPMANGEIPEPARDRLLDMGRWLEVNGEAVFGTTPWLSFGEGPTRMKKSGMFSEQEDVEYTSEDVRYTAKEGVLYAALLGWPENKVILKSLKKLYDTEVKSVSMLGVPRKLTWNKTRAGLEVEMPREKSCEHAFVLKIERQDPF